MNEMKPGICRFSELKIKNLLEPESDSDGFRVLTERLWPKQIDKQLSHIDLWFKKAAPSRDLRKWFNDDPKKWEEFFQDYTFELKKSGAISELLHCLEANQTVTLLYADTDERLSNAFALEKLIRKYLF